ncbi:ankyrin repeat domain-containing protein [Ureibacillus sinduriensis]|uniref:Ankyrin n=1 Tax=Ureibacillus sinduriensis BLB-1 = JCM 15800 TaxID=1384057 RepID=A0A0A3HUT3_9BACL|nr:ankyrin repeat domain-containing protein [Ureibacillus sinduriensis]KGR74975.1 ankyrin [Ureibacillus sinduriensis BLB-1 = JCM 15800]
MVRKKKTLPKNFDELIETGDISALKEVFIQCELDARGGYSKSTALSFSNIPNDLICWLVEQGADINARDNYGRTPLHQHAMSWNGNTRLLLDLGADIEAVDYQNETPLFAAAGSFKPSAVQTLVSRGANFNAKNKMKQTPLEKTLIRCRNIDIVNVMEVAEILLNAGSIVTQGMKDSIIRIGNEFEFHRIGFNKEYLNQTDEALCRLYELFEVSPIAKRKFHDGTSPITISTKGWQAQHHELWNLLIPSKGHAQTVQGEVIRITGKVSYEILDNGGINWDNEFRQMLDSLNHYFSLGIPLQPDVLQNAAILTKKLHNGIGNDEPAKLCELAVQWVLRNPNPITLDHPVYRR